MGTHHTLGEHSAIITNESSVMIIRYADSSRSEGIRQLAIVRTAKCLGCAALSRMLLRVAHGVRIWAALCRAVYCYFAK